MGDPLKAAVPVKSSIIPISNSTQNLLGNPLHLWIQPAQLLEQQ
ncbi:MAG: hypothetical protein ABIM99_05965 [Candidatus Dojkabacteria bacterium]